MRMLTASLRTHIATAIETRLAGACPVHPFGVTGPLTLPAAVLGQPDVDYQVITCVDRWTVGLAVVARIDPQGPEATQRELEALWQQVAAAVRDLERTDPTLGGQVNDFHLTSAMFGAFEAQ